VTDHGSEVAVDGSDTADIDQHRGAAFGCSRANQRAPRRRTRTINSYVELLVVAPRDCLCSLASTGPTDERRRVA
jgi:hypothetical protein